MFRFDFFLGLYYILVGYLARVYLNRKAGLITKQESIQESPTW